MKPIKAFKVVSSLEGGLLRSISPPDSSLAIDYKVGKWVRPRLPLRRFGYGLAVFKSIRTAKGFAFSCMGDVWGCEAIPMDGKKPPLAFKIGDEADNEFEYIIELDDFSMVADWRLNKWPSGTTLCCAVKLIEPIESFSLDIEPF